VKRRRGPPATAELFRRIQVATATKTKKPAAKKSAGAAPEAKKSTKGRAAAKPRAKG